MALPYRALAPALRERFGVSVYRVALDAGSDCPNRDGTKGRGGCVYCDVDGSGTGFLRSGLQIREQLQRGIRKIHRPYPDAKAIAYFQSFSNTYGSPERLREILRPIEDFLPHLAALSIATRPDTFSEEAAAILAEWNRRLPVWVEFGLESAVDETLERINRLHTLAEFYEAVTRARRHDLEIVVHVILGLPGEGPQQFQATAEAVAAARPDGIKIHQLMVLRKTILAHWWEQGWVKTLDWPDYVAHLCDFLERMPEEVVVHRIQGDALPEVLLAPVWPISKNRLRDELVREFRRRGTRQGTRGTRCSIVSP